MNLQKKSSIWKYIFRSDAFKVFVVILILFAHVPFCALLGKIVATVHSPMFRLLTFFSVAANEPFDPSKFFDLYFIGLIEVIVFLLLGIVLYMLHTSLTDGILADSICCLSVYKAARYIPLTEEELKANNIACANDLENFFVTNVFNNIKHGCYVYEVYEELKESYSKVIAIDPKVIELKLNDEEKDRLACRMEDDMDSWFHSGSDDKLHHFEAHLKEIQDDREDDKE